MLKLILKHQCKNCEVHERSCLYALIHEVVTCDKCYPPTVLRVAGHQKV